MVTINERQPEQDDGGDGIDWEAEYAAMDAAEFDNRFRALVEAILADHERRHHGTGLTE